MVDIISKRNFLEDPIIINGDFNARDTDESIQVLLQNLTTVIENRINWIFS